MPLLDLMARGRTALRTGPAFLLGPAVLGALQLAVWLHLYGLGFAHVISGQSYVGETAAYPVDLMLSARHGLFTWTPLYLASVFGWILRARRDAWTAALFATAFGLAVYVNGSMQDWWGSESFGQRRMLGLTPLFALGCAEALAFLRRRPLLLPAPVPGRARLLEPAARLHLQQRDAGLADAGDQPRPPGRRPGRRALPCGRAERAPDAPASLPAALRQPEGRVARRGRAVPGRCRRPGRSGAGGAVRRRRPQLAARGRGGRRRLPPLAREAIVAAAAHPHAHAVRRDPARDGPRSPGARRTSRSR
jgi:hypothetical protein